MEESYFLCETAIRRRHYSNEIEEVGYQCSVCCNCLPMAQNGLASNIQMTHSFKQWRSNFLVGQCKLKLTELIVSCLRSSNTKADNFNLQHDLVLASFWRNLFQSVWSRNLILHKIYLTIKREVMPKTTSSQLFLDCARHGHGRWLAALIGWCLMIFNKWLDEA